MLCRRESGDVEFCAVHVINEGAVVGEQSASLFFWGTAAVQSYRCKLTGRNKENTDFITCKQLCIFVLHYKTIVHISTHC